MFIAPGARSTETRPAEVPFEASSSLVSSAPPPVLVATAAAIEGPWTHWRRDLVRVPGLLSLARVPLAVVFPFVADRPKAALAVVVLSGVTDVLDGWYARTFKQTTATGTVLDPLADKVFVLVVLVALVAGDNLSPMSAILLCSREIGELPLVLFVASRKVEGGSSPARLAPPLANAAGKIATGLQFATIAAAILRSRATPGLVLATAVAGMFAAVSYWARAVGRRA